MKIIFLGDCITTQRAGIHYYAKNLVSQMVTNFPQHEYGIILTEPYPELAIQQFVLPVKKWIPFHLRIRQILTIPRLINRLRPDLVIELAHFGPFNIRPEIKRVTLIHDLTPITHSRLHPWHSVLAHRLFLPGILKRASFIIANSSLTKTELVRHFTGLEEKIIISNPKISDLPQDRIRSTTVGSYDPYFLSVGTLEPRKNHLTILKAFELFCASDDRFQLIIAGADGWKNEEFFEALNQSPYRSRVQLTGYLTRTKLLALYPAAHAFVFASVFEGVGIPILEAAHFSLPLILADNDSLPEGFREAGLLFDPDDVPGLAQHLQLIANDDEIHRVYAAKADVALRNFQAQRSEIERIFD